MVFGRADSDSIFGTTSRNAPGNHGACSKRDEVTGPTPDTDHQCGSLVCSNRLASVGQITFKIPAMSPVRLEQFGRRNRRADVKPAPKKKRIHARPPASGANTKLYLYL